MYTKHIIKNMHKKLIQAGVLVAPQTSNKFDTTNLYIDFNYKNLSFINFSKYSLQFYEILHFLSLIKKAALKVIYIYNAETQITKKLQNIGQITNSYYFTGRWINGFFTNRLFLTTRDLLVKNNKKKFSCPTKPHVAIVFWSKNVNHVLDELHKAGIITILIGGCNLNNYPANYYLPGRDLNIKNYLFYFTLFLTFLGPNFLSKINKIDYQKLFSN